jgi:CheY-like chemotaxis protein
MSLILYVEDHPPARLLMGAIISDLTTHTLITAGSCAEARRLAQAQQPSVYIVDLDLPDGNGIALAQELQSLHPAPTIITSAYAEGAAEKAESAHLFAYLRKPLDPDDVARTVDRAAARLE